MALIRHLIFTEIIINCPTIPPVGILREKIQKNLKPKAGDAITSTVIMSWKSACEMLLLTGLVFFSARLLLLRIFVRSDHNN